MGMFDTFEITKPIVCDHCGKELKNNDGIQSKYFDCTLSFFKYGDVVEKANDKCYKEYDWCSNCDEKIDIYLGFLNGIYVGVFKTEGEVEEAIKNFNLLAKYKELAKSERRKTDMIASIKRSLEDIVDFKSLPVKKHQIKNNFSLMRVIDYNPITAIRKLIERIENA